MASIAVRRKEKRSTVSSTKPSPSAPPPLHSEQRGANSVGGTDPPAHLIYFIMFRLRWHARGVQLVGCATVEEVFKFSRACKTLRRTPRSAGANHGLLSANGGGPSFLYA